MRLSPLPRRYSYLILASSKEIICRLIPFVSEIKETNVRSGEDVLYHPRALIGFLSDDARLLEFITRDRSRDAG